MSTPNQKGRPPNVLAPEARLGTGTPHAYPPSLNASKWCGGEKVADDGDDEEEEEIIIPQQPTGTVLGVIMGDGAVIGDYDRDSATAAAVKPAKNLCPDESTSGFAHWACEAECASSPPSPKPEGSTTAPHQQHHETHQHQEHHPLPADSLAILVNKLSPLAPLTVGEGFGGSIRSDVYLLSGVGDGEGNGVSPADGTAAVVSQRGGSSQLLLGAPASGASSTVGNTAARRPPPATTVNPSPLPSMPSLKDIRSVASFGTGSLSGLTALQASSSGAAAGGLKPEARNSASTASSPTLGSQHEASKGKLQKASPAGASAAASGGILSPLRLGSIHLPAGYDGSVGAPSSRRESLQPCSSGSLSPSAAATRGGGPLPLPLLVSPSHASSQAAVGIRGAGGGVLPLSPSSRPITLVPIHAMPQRSLGSISVEVPPSMADALDALGKRIYMGNATAANGGGGGGISRCASLGFTASFEYENTSAKGTRERGGSPLVTGLGTTECLTEEDNAHLNRNDLADGHSKLPLRLSGGMTSSSRGFVSCCPAPLPPHSSSTNAMAGARLLRRQNTHESWFCARAVSGGRAATATVSPRAKVLAPLGGDNDDDQPAFAATYSHPTHNHDGVGIDALVGQSELRANVAGTHGNDHRNPLFNNTMTSDMFDASGVLELTPTPSVSPIRRVISSKFGSTASLVRRSPLTVTSAPMAGSGGGGWSSGTARTHIEAAAASSSVGSGGSFYASHSPRRASSSYANDFVGPALMKSGLFGEVCPSPLDDVELDDVGGASLVPDTFYPPTAAAARFVGGDDTTTALMNPLGLSSINSFGGGSSLRSPTVVAPANGNGVAEVVPFPSARRDSAEEPNASGVSYSPTLGAAGLNETACYRGAILTPPIASEGGFMRMRRSHSPAPSSPQLFAMDAVASTNAPSPTDVVPPATGVVGLVGNGVPVLFGSPSASLRRSRQRQTSPIAGAESVE